MANNNQSLSQEAENDLKKAAGAVKKGKNLAKAIKKTIALAKNIATAQAKAKLVAIAVAVLLILVILQGLPILIFGALQSHYNGNDNPITNIHAFGGVGAEEGIDESFYHVVGNADNDDQEDETYTNDANTATLHEVKLIADRLNERAKKIKSAIPEGKIKNQCESIFNEKAKVENGGALNANSKIIGTGIDEGLVVARQNIQETDWRGTTININCDDIITYHQALRILAAYNAQTNSRSFVKEMGPTSSDLNKESLSTWLGTDTHLREKRTITFKVAGDITASVRAYEGRFLPQYLYEQREQDICNRPSSITDEDAIKEYNDVIEKRYNENTCALVDLLLTVSGPSSLDSCVRIDEIKTDTLIGKIQHNKKVKEKYDVEEPVYDYYYFNTSGHGVVVTTYPLEVNTYNEKFGYIKSCEERVIYQGTHIYLITYYPACDSSNPHAGTYAVRTGTKTVQKEKTVIKTVDGTQSYKLTTYVGSAVVNINISSRNFDEIAKNIGFWCGDRTQPQGIDVWTTSIYNGGLKNTGTTISAVAVLKNADKAKMLTGYDFTYVTRYIAQASNGDETEAHRIAQIICGKASAKSMNPEQYIIQEIDNGTKNSRSSVSPSDVIYDICYKDLKVQTAITAMKEKFKNREFAQKVLGYDYVTVVQTVMRESGGENTDNQKAVCQVIINRANAQKTNPYNIVSAGSKGNRQFESFDVLWPVSKTTDTVWDTCFEMFVLGGTYTPVRNANYYYRCEGTPDPDNWFETLQFICRIKLDNEGGYHRFFHG